MKQKLDQLSIDLRSIHEAPKEVRNDRLKELRYDIYKCLHDSLTFVSTLEALHTYQSAFGESYWLHHNGWEVTPTSLIFLNISHHCYSNDKERSEAVWRFVSSGTHYTQLDIDTVSKFGRLQEVSLEFTSNEGKSEILIEDSLYNGFEDFISYKLSKEMKEHTHMVEYMQKAFASRYSEGIGGGAGSEPW